MKKILYSCHRDVGSETTFVVKIWEISKVESGPKSTLKIRYGEINKTIRKMYQGYDWDGKQFDKNVADSVGCGFLELPEESKKFLLISCVECGATLGKAQKFCDECGYKVSPKQVTNLDTNTHLEETASLFPIDSIFPTKVLDLYSKILEEKKVHPNQISEATYLGIAYSKLIQKGSVVPSLSGLQIINDAKKVLSKLVE